MCDSLGRDQRLVEVAEAVDSARLFSLAPILDHDGFLKLNCLLPLKIKENKRIHFTFTSFENFVAYTVLE